MSCFDANKPQPYSPDKIVYVVAVVLVDRDGRVLLAQRPPGKKMAGLWEFPGGKIEAGETPEAALVREIKEEMDIDTKESCLAPLTFVSHRYDDFHLFMPVFVCRVWKGMPVSKEGQSFSWVYPKDFDKYPMPPADIPLIPVIKELL